MNTNFTFSIITMNRSDDLELTLDKLSKKVDIFSHNIETVKRISKQIF